MTRSLTPLLLLCTALGCGGSASSSAFGSTSEAIIGGQPCTATQYPYIVAVVANMSLTVTEGGQSGQETYPAVTCTGTLIAPDVVLSAGHCIDPNIYQEELSEQAPSGDSVTVNSIDFYISYQLNLSQLADPTGFTIPTIPTDAVHVIKTVANPGYMLPTSADLGLVDLHDLSLLFLDKAQATQPAVVISSTEATQIAAMDSVEIVGYGQTTDAATPAPGTVGIKECGASFINQLGPSTMQIGGNSSTVRKCHGDSGGPTLFDVKTTLDNPLRLIGVTSHAYDIGDCDSGGVDTRVDAYLSWIDQTMQAECTDHTRVWCDVPGIIPATYYQPATDGGSGTAKSGGCDSAGASVLSLLTMVPCMARRSRRIRAARRLIP